MLLFAKLEKPVAYATFAFAFATLIWKSPIGVDWIPIVGPAWNEIFSTGSNGSRPIAQYPRRSQDESFWHWVYFFMYGVLGSVAQYGGIQISKRSITRESLILYARIYGFFHILIGTHHLVWSVKRAHGKLELWRFSLPGVYLGTTVAALILLYHAVHIVRVTVRTADIKDICYRKSVMDTATCSTFVSFIAFLIANAAGIQTSYQTDRLLWALTMYLVPVVLVLGFVLPRGSE